MKRNGLKYEANRCREFRRWRKTKTKKQKRRNDMPCCGQSTEHCSCIYTIRKHIHTETHKDSVYATKPLLGTLRALEPNSSSEKMYATQRIKRTNGRETKPRHSTQLYDAFSSEAIRLAPHSHCRYLPVRSFIYFDFNSKDTRLNWHGVASLACGDD